MNLFEYIKSQLPHLPNPAIMKNMGASEELIGYVRETVWNTNLNILNSISSGGGGDQGEVWYTGTLGECNEGYKTTEDISETDKANTIDIVANPTTYDVSMNGTPLIVHQTENDSVTFTDSADVSQVTKYVHIELVNGQFHEGQASIKCPTDITNVEITVAHK